MPEKPIQQPETQETKPTQVEAKKANKKTEVLTEKPNKAFEFVNNLKAKETRNLQEKDIQDLKNKPIDEIKYGSVFQKIDNNADEKALRIALKAESLHRMNAYTTGPDKDGYLHIDYQRVGGQEHETKCGLGEIIRDEDITRLEVIKNPDTNGEEHITAIRGVVQAGRYKGRIGYINEQTGEYIATHTGDKFKILSKEPLPKNKYKKTFEKHKEQRTTNKETKKREEIIESMSYTNGDIEENKPLREQLRMNLNAEQIRMIDIIEKEFTDALKDQGLTDIQIKRLAAAAAVNAKHESGFNQKAVGDRGHSIGLFQLHDKGAGHDLSKEYRADPINNTRTIIEREIIGKNGKLKKAGRILINAAKRGASVGTLTALFTKYVERPKSNRAPEIRKRGARRLFVLQRKENISIVKNNNDKQETKTEKTSNRTHINQKIKGIGKLPAKINLKSNQDRWVFGSSSAVHFEKYIRQDSGIFGVAGAGPRQFLSNLKKHINKIKTLKAPKTIILVGMAANSMGSKIEKNIKAYKDIKEYIQKIWPSTHIKFSTVQLADKNPKKSKRFNEALQEEFQNDVIDTTTATSTRNLSGIRKDLAGGDGLHLNPKGKRIYADILENA